MNAERRHRRVPKACQEKGHAWKQKIWGVVGTDVCARRNCDETRLNPLLDTPEYRRSQRSLAAQRR